MFIFINAKSPCYPPFVASVPLTGEAADRVAIKELISTTTGLTVDL
jgi:hypothetical protein